MPYSPQFNPRENFFSRIKDRFKCNKKQAMQTGAQKSPVKLVESAIKKVNDETIKSILGLAKTLDQSRLKFCNKILNGYY